MWIWSNSPIKHLSAIRPSLQNVVYIHSTVLQYQILMSNFYQNLWCQNSVILTSHWHNTCLCYVNLVVHNLEHMRNNILSAWEPEVLFVKLMIASERTTFPNGHFAGRQHRCPYKCCLTECFHRGNHVFSDWMLKWNNTLCPLACRWTGSSVTAAAISGFTKSALASRPRWLRKRTTFVSGVRWWMDIGANEGSWFPRVVSLFVGAAAAAAALGSPLHPALL